ncbi:acyltransferase [Shewanella sp. GD03713]|uniref:acyltransferase n=1 Tax=Shewanella sp. GD03713 TaxID=2975372 RepID=UPI00244BE44D|nr:acyltransferase [Shewanella sp. GD03713]
MFGKLISLYYRLKYKFLDKRVIINQSAFIHHAATFILNNNENARIKIHDNVYVGRFANIHTGSEITIGNNSVLSDYVYLSTLSHGIEPINGPIMLQPSYDKGSIILGENVFLGFGVKVMPNIRLGNWCIVGAGSVVTKSFPEYSMIAGNPAKLIKKYDLNLNKWISTNEFNR